MAELGIAAPDDDSAASARVAALVSTSSKGAPAAAPAGRSRSGDRRPSSPAVLARIERDADDDVATPTLLARISAGDDLAFAELYVRYARRVSRYLEIALKNPSDVEEATQEIFVRVLQKINHYERRSEPFSSWLFRIVRNYALDFQKRAWRTEATDPRVLARRNEANVAPSRERAADIGALIDGLAEPQRRVLVLIYIYDLSIADIAEALDKTPDAIRHIHMRALKAIGPHARDPERLRREGGSATQPAPKRPTGAAGPTRCP